MIIRIDDLQLGRIQINGQIYQEDVVIVENRIIETRNKRSSEILRPRYGHTPLTTAENIPWDCQTLVIGTGIQRPIHVTDEVRTRAFEMGINLVALPTRDALVHLNKRATNLILHITS